MIKVDGSIKQISEVLCKMEADDPPVESQPELATAIQQEAQIKPSYYNHQFTIYKKNIPSLCSSN
jgi:hypothetical protein